jgi:hypothetical protein
MISSLLSNIPAAYRKWVIVFTFIGFLAGVGIGAYVAHQQNTSETPEAEPRQ